METVYSYSPLREILAVFDDSGEPLSLFVRNSRDILPDTVFLARLVKRVQNAWFADIGNGRTGYLYAPKFYHSMTGEKTDAPPTEGSYLFVKAKRDAFESKDVKLSADVQAAEEWIETARDMKKPGVLFVPETVFDRMRKGALQDDGRLFELTEHVLSKEVVLKNGGSVIFEQTAACVAIDVNARGQSEEKTNAEAVPVILREIALRSLSGQMVIDFAGHKKHGSLRKLADKLKQNDQNLQILGISNLGFVEMSKERSVKSIEETFGDQAYNQACDLARKLWTAEARGIVTVSAPHAVLEILRPYLAEFESRLGTEIVFKPSDTAFIEGIRQ